MKRALIGIGLVMVGCGGDSSSDKPTADAGESGDGGNAPMDSGTGTFKLTSTAFAEGAAIPKENSCAAPSPVLAWADAPDAKSFALTVIDSDANDFKHWVIYDILPTATGLPAHVENVYAPGNVSGAHQTASQEGTVGYYGPCPPQGAAHHYHFTLYALDVDKLPGAGQQTTAAQAIAAITTHMTAHAELIGTFQTR